MNKETERQIVAGLKKGESLAFQRLVDMYSNKSIKIAFHFCGNLDDARDVVQDTFIKVIKKIGTFRDEVPFSPWFFRILTNTCRDWKRSFFNRKRSRLLDNEQFGYESEPDFSDTARWIRKFVLHMPAKMRMVFILYYKEGFTVAEITEICRITADTVRVQLMNARKYLRERYTKQEMEEFI